MEKLITNMFGDFLCGKGVTPFDQAMCPNQYDSELWSDILPNQHQFIFDREVFILPLQKKVVNVVRSIPPIKFAIIYTSMTHGRPHKIMNYIDYKQLTCVWFIFHQTPSLNNVEIWRLNSFRFLSISSLNTMYVLEYK